MRLSPGISLLVTPAALFSASAAVLRTYLAVLSGCGLSLALWLWRGIHPLRPLAVAGGLIAWSWITLAYRPQSLPDLWCALGAVAAVGGFLRVARDPSDAEAVIGLAGGAALTAVMRPSEALWLGLPLFAALLAAPRWRNRAVPAALAAGLLLGGVQWLAGARPDSHALAWRYPGVSLWWLALPLMAGAAALVGRRARTLAPYLLPALIAMAMATPYFVLFDESG
ncbi:hypothetical protein GCM10010468_01260 [Actinocorallia longicatena]|uniref:Glycosyltransferase RgtA/B/C/D-like domain-containing protein n=1 Tax=Actinocorallia longicatena TaxID=111803 RepID=A0ABP6PVF0_9ACTN